ncbi:MAG: nucleotide exchange factor GrpE [Planctomycetes bacterium]|nr:nucleotide exchange factor GrpE [Planctomycetota bacterium]
MSETNEQPDETRDESAQGEPAVESPVHEQEFARLRDERDNLEQQLQRTLADTANMRRRQKQEMDESRRRALEGLTQELLPVLDTFSMALSAADNDTADAKSIVEGVKMVRTLLAGVLERHGLVEIPAAGQPFDPLRHEAVAVEPDANVPEGQVLRVLQTGYLLGGRVVRHSRVVVAGPADPNPNQEN